MRAGLPLRTSARLIEERAVRLLRQRRPGTSFHVDKSRYLPFLSEAAHDYAFFSRPFGFGVTSLLSSFVNLPPTSPSLVNDTAQSPSSESTNAPTPTTTTNSIKQQSTVLHLDFSRVYIDDSVVDDNKKMIASVANHIVSAIASQFPQYPPIQHHDGDIYELMHKFVTHVWHTTHTPCFVVIDNYDGFVHACRQSDDTSLYSVVSYDATGGSELAMPVRVVVPAAGPDDCVAPNVLDVLTHVLVHLTALRNHGLAQLLLCGSSTLHQPLNACGLRNVSDHVSAAQACGFTHSDTERLVIDLCRTLDVQPDTAQILEYLSLHFGGYNFSPESSTSLFKPAAVINSLPRIVSAVATNRSLNSATTRFDVLEAVDPNWEHSLGWLLARNTVSNTQFIQQLEDGSADWGHVAAVRDFDLRGPLTTSLTSVTSQLYALGHLTYKTAPPTNNDTDTTTPSNVQPTTSTQSLLSPPLYLGPLADAPSLIVPNLASRVLFQHFIHHLIPVQPE
eukprot:c8562_g1_i2.p1 GENE.c8562_g1_i2~~c8562_g1_i2.p1  ORF type:complete len:515 (+),score=142.03 c8562_g1_i2:32-1546(+)